MLSKECAARLASAGAVVYSSCHFNSTSKAQEENVEDQPVVNTEMSEREIMMINDMANLRLGPGTGYEVIARLERGELLEYVQTIVSNEGWINQQGIFTNRWVEINYNGQLAYVWEPLTDEWETDKEYSDLIFAGCGNYFILGNVTDLRFNGKDLNYQISDVMNEIQYWHGRDIWQGYDHPDFPLDLPGDPSELVRVGGLEMILQENDIPGRYLSNDRTGIWFLEHPADSSIIIVFPFRSYEQFTDANGGHNGSHLCGVAEIDKERVYDPFVDWLINGQKQQRG